MLPGCFRLVILISNRFRLDRSDFESDSDYFDYLEERQCEIVDAFQIAAGLDDSVDPDEVPDIEEYLHQVLDS